MPLVAPGPQKEECVNENDLEELLIKKAIDRATDECSDDMPLTLQLCKIGAAVDKAKKQAKAQKARIAKKEALEYFRLDHSINTNVSETLTTTWLARYSYRLHPTQEGTHQILGSMLRSFMQRQISTENVKSLRTLHFTKGYRTKEANPQHGRVPNASQ